MKRTDYINWDEYFMGIALLTAMRSKDPSSQVGACIVSPENNLKGARVYVTLFPCNECTKAIIQSGIAEVVYYSDKYHDTDSSVAARFMFQKAGVRLTPYQPSGRKAELEL